MLLARGARDAALAEILALSANLPDESSTVPSRIELGRLFLSAGDLEHAQESFVRVLQDQPDDTAALLGAGEAAFRLADYDAARRYLERTLKESGGPAPAHRMLEVSTLVLLHDPLAPRVRTAERHRRLHAAFDHILQRLEQCAADHSATPDVASKLRALAENALVLRQTLRSPAGREDADIIGGAMHMIYDAEQAAHQHCGPPIELDEALSLITREEEREEP